MAGSTDRTTERSAQRERLRRIAVRVMVVQIVTLLALLWLQHTFGA